MLGWEEKAKERHRNDGEEEEFFGKVEHLDLGTNEGRKC